MSSSIVCQGLQSCLEPGLTEQRTLALLLASPKPHLFKRTKTHAGTTTPTVSALDTVERQCNNKESGQKDLGTFTSVYSLTDQTPKDSGNIQRSLFRSSFQKLSGRSLELCTENLGCETGTDIITTDLSSHSSSSSSDSDVKSFKPRERIKPCINSIHKKENFGSFPPPLTSIAGQSSIHVRPHREGGRLVLKAVTVPTTHTYFQAERSEGRLRLRILKKGSPALDAEAARDDEPEEDKETEGETHKKESILAMGATTKGEEEEEEGEEGWSGLTCLGRRRNEKEGTNGNENDDWGEMGIGKYQRPGRCKESGHGNKGLLNWEPCWVASS